MTELPSAPERRLSHRNEMDIPVLLERQGGNRGAPSLVKARTRDINHQGVFVWAPLIYRVGERLRLEMTVSPDPGRNLQLNIKCEAEVVRVEQPAAPHGRSGLALRILEFQPATPVLAQMV